MARGRAQLPSPPFSSQAEIVEVQEALAELSYEDYLLLEGAPPAGACDCCSCNATRNHADCYESDDGCDDECVTCDPRVMCSHCGSCWCSVPDDYDDESE